MDLDDDIVSTSLSNTPIRGAGVHSQRLPPLPNLSGLMAQFSRDLPSASLQGPSALPQRAVSTSARTSRSSTTSRSLSLENWVIPSAPSQQTSSHQVMIDSLRRDVISVIDDSEDDVVIDSDQDDDGENYIEIDDDSQIEDVDSDEREPIDVEAGHQETDGSSTGVHPIFIETDNTAGDVTGHGFIIVETSRPQDALSAQTHNTPIVDAVPEATITNISHQPLPNASLPVSITSLHSPSTMSTASNIVEPVQDMMGQALGAVVQVSTTETNPTAPSSPSSLVSRVIVRHNDSLSEFRSPKRKRVLSPEKSSASGSNSAAATSDLGEEEEGDSCPICFEPWTTTGNHRLCSLKCGHLFGQSCIEKWLRGQGGKCPHCNAKAKRQDVRVLFAKTIKALDTSERDHALKDLEKERELRRKVEMEAAQLRLQYQMSIEDTNKLRLELETLKSQIRRSGLGSVSGNLSQVKVEPASKNSQLSGQFMLEKTIKIWEGGNCRVMAYSHSLATLVVSQPSSSALFPGFGIKKISALDFKTSQYLTIHSKAIRDMAFHQTVEDGILLSCGLDKKVKMTSLISNAVVQSYDTPMPAWSCAWNRSDCNYFYAGLQNGLVLQFDVRNTGEPVKELNKDGSRSPVASLVHVSENPGGEFRTSGLLIGQLDRASFLQSTHQGDRIHILPLEGSLTSLHVEQQTRHMLASYRPTARHPTIRHQLCELTSSNISTNPSVIDNVCSCNVVHTFHGGRTQTVMSKTLIQRHPADENRLLVCGGDETNNSVHIWDSGTGQLTQRLLADGTVVDLCKFSINNQQYLGALTDKQCKVFKWR